MAQQALPWVAGGHLVHSWSATASSQVQNLRHHLQGHLMLEVYGPSSRYEQITASLENHKKGLDLASGEARGLYLLTRDFGMLSEV